MPGENSPFTVVESAYGRFVINRHALHQADALIKTGRTHMESDLQQILAIVRSLPKDAIAIDAGANIGVVAVPMAQALKSGGGGVIAYEPQRMLFYALCGTAALNDLRNLYAYNQAVGAKNDWITVPDLDYGAAQDFGQLSLVGGDPSAPGDRVPVATIDGLELPRLDFLKIDVEGMELDVLKGGEQTLRAHQPWCWIEYWKVGIEPIKAAFAGLRYRFFKMNELDLLCAPAERLAASKLAIAAPEA
jgi:FkbM family methyltransferase